MQDNAANIVAEVRKRNMPLRADGLFFLQNCLEVVKGYASAVLTPDVMEFKRLGEKMELDPKES
jgi:ATP-dependent NAD(P)H-hydrate dehydratase